MVIRKPSRIRCGSGGGGGNGGFAALAAFGLRGLGLDFEMRSSSSCCGRCHEMYICVRVLK